MRISFVVVLLLLAAPATFAAAPPATTAASSDLPHIALTGHAISPAQLFDEITKDTGIAFVPREANLWSSPGVPGSVDVNIDEPFWSALHRACLLCKLAVAPGDDGSFDLTTGDGGVWGHKPAASTPIATFVINAIVKDSVIKLYRPDVVRRMQHLDIQAFIDPRLHASASKVPLKIVQATDNQGHDLKPIEREYVNQSTHGWILSFNQDFVAPETADHIAVLKAEITLLVDDKTQNWDSADVSTFTPATRKIDGFDVTMKITRMDRGFEVSLESHRGQGDVKAFQTLDAHLEDWTNRMRLIDAAGKSYDSGGGGGEGGNDAISRDMDFQADDGEKMKEPVKLSWPVPVSARLVPVTFEFKDLPLP